MRYDDNETTARHLIALAGLLTLGLAAVACGDVQPPQAGSVFDLEHDPGEPSRIPQAQQTAMPASDVPEPGRDEHGRRGDPSEAKEYGRTSMVERGDDIRTRRERWGHASAATEPEEEIVPAAEAMPYLELYLVGGDHPVSGGVPLAPVLEVRADGRLDRQRLVVDLVQRATETEPPRSIPVAVSWSSDAKTIWCVPDELLEPDRGYVLRATQGTGVEVLAFWTVQPPPDGTIDPASIPTSDDDLYALYLRRAGDGVSEAGPVARLIDELLLVSVFEPGSVDIDAFDRGTFELRATLGEGETGWPTEDGLRTAPIRFAGELRGPYVRLDAWLPGADAGARPFLTIAGAFEQGSTGKVSLEGGSLVLDAGCDAFEAAMSGARFQVLAAARQACIDGRIAAALPVAGETATVPRLLASGASFDEGAGRIRVALSEARRLYGPGCDHGHGEGCRLDRAQLRVELTADGRRVFDSADAAAFVKPQVRCVPESGCFLEAVDVLPAGPIDPAADAARLSVGLSTETVPLVR